ncbi:MAG: class IV adenylate cyclase [Planctomycetota bacterium]|jgi:predicted adenylyl cyclase CyaB
MHTEIEAKLKVDSRQQVADRLEKLGAEFIEKQFQTDYYFDDEKSSMKSNDKALRIRHQKTEKAERIFLAFKGAGEKSRFKKRLELEIEVSDLVATSDMLRALGYCRKLVVEKDRDTWQFRGCELALDHLPVLGDFVEIEGPGEEMIDSVKKDLQLETLSHIPESYADLVSRRLGENP